MQHQLDDQSDYTGYIEKGRPGKQFDPNDEDYPFYNFDYKIGKHQIRAIKAVLQKLRTTTSVWASHQQSG